MAARETRKGRLAQQVEQRFCKPSVESSIPSLTSESIPENPMSSVEPTAPVVPAVPAAPVAVPAAPVAPSAYSLKGLAIQGIMAVVLIGGGTIWLWNQSKADKAAAEPKPAVVVVDEITTPPGPNKPDEKAVATADAKVELVDPKVAARVGQLIIIDASPSIGKVTWKSDTKFMAVEDGRKIAFSAEEEGEYQFVIVAENNGSVDVMVYRIVVTAPLPPLTDMQRKVKQLTVNIVKYPNKKADALKLAENFSKIADEIKPGDEGQTISDKTKVANRESLGADLPKWKLLLDGLGAELAARYDAKQLETPEQYATLWREISDALVRLSDEW